MLNFNTVRTGADLAAVLTTQGVQLAPKGGSPLSKLNQTLLGAGLGIINGLTTDPDPVADASWMSMMVEHSNTNLPDGSESEYQAYMAALADQVANSVSGTIDFARNTVNPIIKDICDKISDALDLAGQGGSIGATAYGQRFSLSNGSLVVNILEEGPEMIYVDSDTESEISARLRVPYQNVRSPVVFPELSSAALMELMENNNSNPFVKNIIEYLKSWEEGYQYLIDTYNEVYRRFPGRPTGIDIKNLTGNLTVYPLVILAIATVLAEELPEGTYGGANQVLNLLGDWSTQVKNIIEINIDVYKQSLADKKIVLNSYTQNFETQIHVNKENYRSFLEDGGSTEALLGSIFSDKDYDYDNLISNLQKYEEVYARRVAEAASFNEANRLTIFKNTLRAAVYDEIFHCEEGAIRPVREAESREALDSIMKTIYVDALDHPHQTVRRVVCNTLFIGTDAEEILVNIDNVCDKNENLSVRDASALVVLDYLTKYLVSQMEVTRIA